MIKINMDSRYEIISRLKLIASLKQNEKLNTKSLCVQPDTVITSISRRFYVYDNRINMIFFVKKTIKDTFDILSNQKITINCPEEKIIFNNILDDLSSCLIGLDNLKKTYSCDTKINCDLDTVIQLIKAKLENTKKYDIEILI
jgi:hypothetical protein